MAYNAQQQAVIDEAQRRATANGTTAEREAFNYAQSIGMNPLEVDKFFGWGSGTTGKYGVDNGLLPAPQSSYTPQTSANLGMGGGVQALGADQRAQSLLKLHAAPKATGQRQKRNSIATRKATKLAMVT